jgi:hypothetical protein
MKKVLALLFLCVSLGSAQYNQYPINYIFQDTTLADAPFPLRTTLGTETRDSLTNIMDSGELIIGKNGTDQNLSLRGFTTEIRLSEENIHFTDKTSNINMLDVSSADSSLTVYGSLKGLSWLRGTSSFSGTDVVKSIYLAGAASTDYYVVTPLAADATTAPVAGDLLNCFAKTDSLIVLRAAGTTSGLGFNYIRVK